MSDAVEANGAGSPEPLGPHQKEFMEICIECFQKGINGVLEFGENKGRRGLLLCSALSFLQNVTGGPVKRVLYLCGSGEELSNTIDEFKRSVYASMRMVVVNDLNNLEALLEHLKPLHNDSEEMQPERCIILSTQELFFDFILSFPSPEYDLKGTLVLIDDAFEIEEKCQSFSSLSLCKLDQLTKLLQGFKDAERIIAKLDGLKKVFRSISLNLGAWYDPVFKGMEISNVLHQCNAELNDSDIQYLKTQGVSCEEVLHFMSTTKRFNCHVMTESNHMTSELIKQNLPAFNMYVTNKFKKQENHTESCQDSCKTLNFLCLDPSILFKMMTEKSPHSIILSSAIISPQSTLKTELGLLDAREFTGKCSVEDFQVFARTVQCGPDGQFLEMRSGSDCFNLGYVTSMGKTILEVAKAMPAGMGMTIYFNSTAILRQFKEKWLEKKPHQQSFWELIGQEKEIISLASHNDLKQFNTNIGQQKGSCIFAVLKDEESRELVNSSMDCHRVLMIIGEPFPLQQDDPNPKVTRKMVYNSDRLASGQGGLTSHKYNRWENIKPIKKVLDDIIHTKHDYGVILLCDCGFQYAEELPPWLRGQLRTEMRFSAMLNELKEFLENIERRTKWIMATADNPAQSNIQFGNVKAWEVEKVKVELAKLKKENSHREFYRQRLRDSIITKRNEKDALVKKLEELNVRITENLRHAAIKAEGGCSQLSQCSPMKGPSQLSPMKRPSMPSPGKSPSQLSPMKRPSMPSPGKGPSLPSPGKVSILASPGKVSILASPGKVSILPSPGKVSILPSPGKEPSPRKRPYPENH